MQKKESLSDNQISNGFGVPFTLKKADQADRIFEKLLIGLNNYYPKVDMEAYLSSWKKGAVNTIKILNSEDSSKGQFDIDCTDISAMRNSFVAVVKNIEETFDIPIGDLGKKMGMLEHQGGASNYEAIRTGGLNNPAKKPPFARSNTFG